MILNEVNFMSETLGLLSSMYVLIPQRKLADAQKSEGKSERCIYCMAILTITTP